MPTRRDYGSYDDGCAAAHALDLVGDRWALIVVRELVLGPKRFVDLRADIPGISATVLTQRLRELEEIGVVVQAELPPPARVRVYDLTDWGKQLEDVLQSLGRWGAQSPRMPHEAHITDDTAILATRTMGAHAVTQIQTPVRLQLRLRSRGRADRFSEYAVVLAPGESRVTREALDGADAIVTTGPNTWADVLLHGADVDAEIAAGTLSVEGDRAALDRLVAAYPVLNETPV